MTAKHIRQATIDENITLRHALEKLDAVGFGKVLFVVDGEGTFVGAIGKSDCGVPAIDEVRAKDVVNRHAKCIRAGNNVHAAAAGLFSRHDLINALPVLDENRKIVDIVYRNAALCRKYFDYNSLKPKEIENCGTLAELRYLHYGFCIFSAAFEAKLLGRDRISVLEFGVASGTGLMECERFAAAVEEETNVRVEVYGFDLGSGLPPARCPEDMTYNWGAGDYPMGNQAALREKLARAKLVIGDIKTTVANFTSGFAPAPVGAMLIDVDYHSSASDALSLLDADAAYLLPRIFMYFDDIPWDGDFIGEELAVREFNRTHEHIKIMPEGSGNQLILSPRLRPFARIKRAHVLRHPQYSAKLYPSGATRAVF